MFTPAIPFGGYLGWRIFDQSAARQLAAFEDEPSTIRNVEYFKENIRTALTAEDLVNDRQLLTVALGAFGLSDEIDKRALIRRVLEDGTEQSDAFANRLNDSRWRDFSESFGYGNFAGSRVLLSSFREEVSQQYIERAFEASVGDIDTDIRLAMNFRREITKIADSAAVDRTGWFQIMGQQPLRLVMEAALGLPASIGTANIDKQKQLFEEKFSKLFPDRSLSAFKDPSLVEDVLKRFFLQAEIRNGPNASTRGMGAVAILSSTASTSAQTINLILSNAT